MITKEKLSRCLNEIPTSTIRIIWGTVRLVPSHFSCPRCGLWVGFDEFAVHQGKDGAKLRSVVTFSPSVPEDFVRIDRLPIFQCEKE